MSLENVNAKFEIEFECISQAQIIYKAIKPEIDSSAKERSSAQFKQANNKLMIDIEARDATSLRAALNSYLRWIILSYDLLKLNESFD